MNTDPIISRRGLLVAGASVAGAAALAACASGANTQSAGGASRQPESPAGQPATSDAETSAASRRSPAAHKHKSAARPTGKSIATLADIEVGEAVAVDLPNGDPAIVARPSASTAVCFSAICTHQGCTVAPAGSTLDCPCHGSQFDARSGKVLRGPAPTALAQVAVQVSQGKVYTA